MYNMLISWLTSGSMVPFTFFKRSFKYTLIRVQKSDDFEYIFAQEIYGKEPTVQPKRFEYAGVYCKNDGRLYDASKDIFGESDGWEELQPQTKEELQHQLRQTVREKVESVVGNDRNNLKISGLTSPMLLENLKYMNEYYASNIARRIFLGTSSSEKTTSLVVCNGLVHTVFHCEYVPEEWTEESLLAYILDSNGFAEKEAENYVSDHQQDMLYQFLANDVLQREYMTLLADAGNPVHIIRKIMTALKASPAKTVNVTIVKNGTELTFKTDADDFRRDCGSYYNSWRIAAPDRKKFEKIFGRSADYTPEEILCITYGRKVLYEAEKSIS